MTDANEALRKLVILAKSGAATDFDVNELARTVRAHLSGPGYVRVPVAKCPNCDDVGWYAIDAGNGEPEQCQCEFCYTVPNSIFNVNTMLTAATKEARHD